MYWTSGFHQSAHVAAFSAGETEVKKLMSKVDYIHRFLPAGYRARGAVNITAADFDGASSITAYPATKKAGIGTTLKLAVFDEAAFHAYLRDNQGAVVPALGDFGQLLMLSTADPSLGESGHFHDFYFASKAGKTNCQAVFLPADIRPGRDEAWFANERLKYPGDPERFLAFYPFNDSDAFVGRAGLVYPEFKRETHVITGMPEARSWVAHVVGIDIGGGDATAVTPIAIWKNTKPGALNSGTNFFQWDEFWRKSTVATDDLIEYLAECARIAPITKVLVGETGGNIITNTLLRAGFPAERFLGNRETGLPLVRGLIQSSRLKVHADCANSIREFSGYRWLERTDPNSHEKYATSTPADNHADAMDARRYALVWAVTQMERPQVMAPVAMNWGAKRAG